MKILVAGGTGAIGRPLIAQLLAKGHTVVALTRSAEKAQTVAERGVEPVVADVFDAAREWLPAFARWLEAPPPPHLSIEDGLRTRGADAVYYGTRMRGVSNARAKRELAFQPRTLEWTDGTAVARAAQAGVSRLQHVDDSQ